MAAPEGVLRSSQQQLRDARAPAAGRSGGNPGRGFLVPQGGRHAYLFTELLAWLGVALAAQQLNALLVACGMASYLSGRAVASTRWYRQRFGEAYPASRKHIVPFVF